MEGAMNRFAAELNSGENLVLLPDQSRFSLREINTALEAQGLRGAVVFQSSGSTGQGRLVCHSKAGLLASAKAVNAHLQASGDDVWLCALPAFHVGGFGIYARAFCLNNRVFALETAWDATAFCAALEQHEVTLTSLVPTQVYDLVQEEKRCPSSLRAVLVGGGRLEPELEAAARQLGWPILLTYGLSEAGSQVATQQGENLTLLSHITAELASDGTLKLRGDSMATGYLSQSDDGSWKLEPLCDEEGWFHTDDLVEIEGDHLKFIARRSSRVKVLGELVDVEALEQLAKRLHPELEEAVVIDVPDDRRGHRLLLVHSSELSDLEVAAAIDSLNAVVVGFERIARAVRVDSIPRSALGKVRRGELREIVCETEK